MPTCHACYEFPAAAYGPLHFHCERVLNSWNDPLDLNAGWLTGLTVSAHHKIESQHEIESRDEILAIVSTRLESPESPAPHREGP